MSDRAELKRKLCDAGLARVADQIAQLARPCYLIDRTLTPEEQIPIGASKFGGSPDVPADFSWPEFGVNLTEFVGQIHLADLPQPLVKHAPSSGLLSFFTAWGEGRVLYFPEGTVLSRTTGRHKPAGPAPSGLWQKLKAEFKRKPTDRRTFRAGSLSFQDWLSIPDRCHAVLEVLKLNEDEQELYGEFIFDWWGPAPSHGEPRHQIFGHAFLVQNEMEFECDLTRKGRPFHSDTALPDRVQAAQDWCLLLQVDTDDGKDGPGWMWGDAGMVYFWIHREDLAARAFDRVVCIEQCH